MSKGLRWTIYSFFIVAAIGFGYCVTFQQSPENYVPVREAPRMN